MSLYHYLTSIIICMCPVYSGRSDPRWSIKDNAVFYSMIELVCSDGYHIQEHNVVTEDGYILTVHRIPNGKRRPKVPRKLSHYNYVHKGFHRDFEKCYNESKFETSDGVPVILAHGVFAASDNWVIQGPNSDLAYLLADAGYDVWFTNTRGNFYSRAHTSISPSNPKFWNFSFHEPGVFDLPALIDYILQLTNQEKVMYVGHSMGTTIFFTMASARPEYNNKVLLFVGYAPVAQIRRENVFPPRVGLLVLITTIIKAISDRGVRELFPRSTLASSFEQLLCGENSPIQDFCYDIPFSFLGYHSKLFLRDKLPLIMSHVTSGTSVKILQHYLQMIMAPSFQQYDYGKENNLKLYGREEPPIYDLHKVTSPVFLCYSTNDYIVDSRDVSLLLNNLSNVVATQIVKKYSHADFMWAYNAKELLYKGTMELMDRFRKQSPLKSNSLTT